MPGVEEGTVVVGPGEVGGDVGEDVAEPLAGRQVLEAHREEIPSNGVDGVGHQVLCGADLDIVKCEIFMSFSHGGDVEHDFLVGFEGPLLTAVDEVLASFDLARVVEVVVALVGDAVIVLLDPADDFVEELLLERLGVLHDGFEVVVLGLEVGDDLGVLAHLEPVVVVDADVAVGLELVGNHFGYRGLGEIGNGSGGRLGPPLPSRPRIDTLKADTWSYPESSRRRK